ncbi:hypothetical protein BC628DRAFT_663849 [Trametes gibbosa]|nr:hypothetical protein BC628DRAFT_663849 [Trametes gibbosa]
MTAPTNSISHASREQIACAPSPRFSPCCPPSIISITSCLFFIPICTIPFPSRSWASTNTAPIPIPLTVSRPPAHHPFGRARLFLHHRYHSPTSSPLLPIAGMQCCGACEHPKALLEHACKETAQRRARDSSGARSDLSANIRAPWSQLRTNARAVGNRWASVRQTSLVSGAKCNTLADRRYATDWCPRPAAFYPQNITHVVIAPSTSGCARYSSLPVEHPPGSAWKRPRRTGGRTAILSLRPRSPIAEASRTGECLSLVILKRPRPTLGSPPPPAKEHPAPFPARHRVVPGSRWSISSDMERGACGTRPCERYPCLKRAKKCGFRRRLPLDLLARAGPTPACFLLADGDDDSIRISQLV